MKILVAYYSRTGNTKKVAEKIAGILKADTDEIVDLKDRKRVVIGWVISGRDAMKKKETQIRFNKNPDKYDLVVIGTPIWVWNMTPAVRTYLKQNREIKKVAFFCTFGGSSGKTFEEMKKLSKKPLALLEIKDKEVEQSDDKIKEFCKKLR